MELQVLKSTADGVGAREFYNKLTKPMVGWEGEIRDIVLRKKQVRALWVAIVCFVFDLSAGEEDLCPTQYPHRRWRSSAQGVSTDLCWGHPELRRAEAAQLNRRISCNGSIVVQI